jgi:fused signal recognition particle receptor
VRAAPRDRPRRSYQELEAQLLRSRRPASAATQSLIAKPSAGSASATSGLENAEALAAELKSAMTKLLEPLEKPLPANPPKPYVILLAGVNGAGKTTTIAKLTRLFQSRGERCSSPPAIRFARPPSSSSRSGARVTASP